MNKKIIYGSGLNVISKLAGIDAAKKFDTYLRFHRKLNLKNPTTLADKVTYIELHEQSPLASMCTDKYAVREYIKSKGYGNTLVPLAYEGVWNSVDEIDFDELPESFVIKATHGCGMNYIVPDKTKLDIGKCKKTLQKWLNTTYGKYSLEPHYTTIPHRLYAEKYLGWISNMIDYKFHCLNGVPNFVMTTSERAVDVKGHKCKRNLFDMEWTPIREIVNSETELNVKSKLLKPKFFEQMSKMAEDLSRDFKFVRVDLYEMKDQIYFSELTFSPVACVFPKFSEKFLEKMGKSLAL